MPDIFIELDRDFEGYEEPPPRPSRFGNRWRPWVAAGLVVAALSTLGSAGLRPRDPIELVAEFRSTPMVQMLAVDGQLIMHETKQVRSIDLATSEERWRVLTEMENGYFVEHGEELIVSGFSDMDGIKGEPMSESMGIETATGRLLWKITGYVQVFEDLLLAYMPSPGLVGDGGMAVYTRDAKPIWSLEPSESFSALNEERHLIGTLKPATGEVVERSLATGEIANRYTFPELVGAEGIHYADGQLMAFFNDGRTKRFDGITISELPDDGPIRLREPEPIDCGRVWCRPKGDGPGYHLSDKVTGQKVHEAGDWEIILRTEMGLLGLSYPSDDGPMPAISLFEPVSGKVTAIPGWSVLEVRFRMDSLPVANGPTYMWSYKNGLDYFGVLGAERVSIIGVLPHTGELRRCAVVAPHLACLVGTDLVRIWRLT